MLALCFVTWQQTLASHGVFAWSLRFNIAPPPRPPLTKMTPGPVRHFNNWCLLIADDQQALLVSLWSFNIVSHLPSHQRQQAQSRFLGFQLCLSVLSVSPLFSQSTICHNSCSYLDMSDTFVSRTLSVFPLFSIPPPPGSVNDIIVLHLPNFPSPDYSPWDPVFPHYFPTLSLRFHSLCR